MKRTKDLDFSRLAPVNLKKARVLEVGCGRGWYTQKLLDAGAQVSAIDPDSAQVRIAWNCVPKADVKTGTATCIQFRECTFDIVFFSLSLHYIAPEEMHIALTEVVRVLKKEGVLVVLEPDFEGTLFEIECKCQAGDGDERVAKAQALIAMLTHRDLIEVHQFFDVTHFQFDDWTDFFTTMQPKMNIPYAKELLKKQKYLLTANRRIHIFTVNH